MWEIRLGGSWPRKHYPHVRIPAWISLHMRNQPTSPSIQSELNNRADELQPSFVFNVFSTSQLPSIEKSDVTFSLYFQAELPFSPNQISFQAYVQAIDSFWPDTER